MPATRVRFAQHGFALALGLFSVAGWAQPASDEPPPATKPSEEADVVPVDSLEQPVDDLVPLLPLVEWTLSANVQLDALAHSDLPEDREDTAELRRAHLSMVLDVKQDWRFKFGLDAAERAPVRERSGPLRDLSVEYRGLPVYFEFGKFVEPFGMLQGGSRNAALMERPQAAGLAPGYGRGIAMNGRGSRGGFTLGVFQPVENDVFFGAREDSAITARGTFVPLLLDDAMVHVGLAASAREPVNGLLQFVTIPESVLLKGLNTSSAQLITEDYELFGAELAGQWGPVVVRSEYILAKIGDSIRLDDVFGPDPFPDGFTFIRPEYTGWYGEVAWVVTGERRDYSVRRGMFSGIFPDTPLFQGGFGAIEVAARHSAVDLIDERGGGEKGAVTSVGINWYPLEFLKLMVVGLRVGEEDAAGTREEIDAVQLRLQAHYSLP